MYHKTIYMDFFGKSILNFNQNEMQVLQSEIKTDITSYINGLSLLYPDVYEEDKWDLHVYIHSSFNKPRCVVVMPEYMEDNFYAMQPLLLDCCETHTETYTSKLGHKYLIMFDYNHKHDCNCLDAD